MAASGRVFQFKLVLLGDSAVGKSSLVLRFVRGQFFEYQESTIGAAFLTQTVALNDTTVKFEIWDTAGQERYHSLAPMYYRGAAAAIVVYDITNRVMRERPSNAAAAGTHARSLAHASWHRGRPLCAAVARPAWHARAPPTGRMWACEAAAAAGASHYRRRVVVHLHVWPAHPKGCRRHPLPPLVHRTPSSAPSNG